MKQLSKTSGTQESCCCCCMFSEERMTLILPLAQESYSGSLPGIELE